MATRACIKIEGVTFAKVYKHWDGYPSKMLPWLETFNKEFTDTRGDDPEHKFAQLLRSSAEERFELDKSKSTGYGIVEYKADCCEEFVYTLKKDGTVTVE